MTNIIKKIYKSLTVKILKGSKLQYIKIKFFLLIQELFPFLKNKITKKIKKTKNEWIIKINTGKFFIQSHNDSFGKSQDYFEKYIRSYFTKKKGNIFFDIGSNIGFYSILLINKKLYKQAYAFEPNPDTYKILSKNIKLNKLTKKITPNQIALGEKQTTVNFFQDKYHTGGSKIIENSKKHKEFIKIKKISFDKFIQNNKIDIKNIDLIKIDVEGHEHQVLKGMKNFLKDSKKGTRIIIEIWDKNKTGKESKKLLKKSGYEILKKYQSQHLLQKNN
ncbi:MAG: FkbM family methyltransferase [Candidatus Woesearchaeota archaeon]